MTLKIRPNAIEQDFGPFTFPGVRLPNDGLHILDTDASHHLVIKPGSNLSADRILTITTGDAARTITLSGDPTLGDWFDQSVKQASTPTFGGLTINGAIALDGDLNFQGPQTIMTTSGDLTISPADQVYFTTFVGFGTNAPDAPIHILMAGTVMNVGANTGLVVQKTSASAQAWLSIIAHNAGVSQLNFGHEGDEDIGYIKYHQNSNYMAFGVETVEVMRYSGGKLGIHPGGYVAPDGTLHVHTATAGVVTASADADDLVVENSTTGGITILTPNTVAGNLFFGDPEDADVGGLSYRHSHSQMEFRVAGAIRHYITANEHWSEVPFKIKEAAAAVADTAGYGQLWIRTATPNQLWFTDDAGNDVVGFYLGAAAFTGATTISTTAGDLTLDSATGYFYLDYEADGPSRLYLRSQENDIGGSVGILHFQGHNDAAQNVTYARITSTISDDTDGTEDGNLYFYTISEGVQANVMRLTGGGANTTTTEYHTSLMDGDGDLVFRRWLRGKNDAAQTVIYAEERVYISDNTDGTEDGDWRLYVMNDGSLYTGIRITGSQVVINEDSTAMDFRVESDSYVNMFKVSGAGSYVGIGTATANSIAYFSPSGIVLNEEGLDRDFRVESNANANMLYVDGGNDRVGVGTNVPASDLHIYKASSDALDEDGIRVSRPGSIANFGYFSHNVGNALYIGSNYTGGQHGVILFEQTDVGAVSTRIAFSLLDTEVVVNDQSKDINFRVESDGNQNMLFVDAGNSWFGVGTGTPLATFHVDQLSSIGAVPVLILDQADVSEEFIKFIGAAASGVETQSLVEETDGVNSVLKGWLRIYVDDVGNQIVDDHYYIPFYELQ